MKPKHKMKLWAALSLLLYALPFLLDRLAEGIEFAANKLAAPGRWAAYRSGVARDAWLEPACRSRRDKLVAELKAAEEAEKGDDYEAA